MNVLLLPEKDYSPTQFLNVTKERDGSCDGVNIDDNMARTSKHSLSTASEAGAVRESLTFAEDLCASIPSATETI